MEALRRRKPQSMQASGGQSLVEMSFVLPFLLILFFGIIDLGYFIYCYGSVHQAVRRGSTTAAYYPPYITQLGNKPYGYNDDPCVQHVIHAVQKGAVLVDYSDIITNRLKFGIAYRPSPDPSAPYGDYRAIGNTVEVTMSYTVEPLTPLMSLIPVFGQRGITIHASSMRTILSQGESYLPGESPCDGTDPNCKRRIVCRR